MYSRLLEELDIELKSNIFAQTINTESQEQ